MKHDQRTLRNSHRAIRRALRAFCDRAGLGVLVLTALATPAAAATIGPGLQVNTFGTVGWSRVNTAGVHLRQAITADNGIGPEWTAAYDTRVGVQVSRRLGDGLGVTWQGVIQRQNDGGFHGNTQWAYLDWKLMPDWDVKVGRFQSPLYLASDERHVGLGVPWVRPPAEVYGLLGNVDALDGLWLRHRWPLGEDTLMVNLYAAQHREARGGFRVSHQPLTGINLRLAQAEWTWHAMVAQARTRLQAPADAAAFQALALLGNPATGGDPLAAQDYDFREIKPLRFVSLGVRHDGLTWLAMAEWARTSSSNRAFPGSEAYYLTAGRRWGDWLGYMTYARMVGRAPADESRFSGVADAVLQAYLTSLREAGQTSVGVGARWDFQRGLALKLQVDQVRPRTEGRGGLVLEPSLPAGRRSVWLYSATLDWAY
jgi:hypothetical protein